LLTTARNGTVNVLLKRLERRGRLARASADQAQEGRADGDPATRDTAADPGSPSTRSIPPGWAEVLPILVLIGVVQASVLLPGSLIRPIFFWISTGLLLILPALFWNRYPRSILTPALIYVASVCCLNIAANQNSGLGLLLFLPIVGVALNGSRAESAVIVVSVLVGSIIIGLFVDVSITALVRRAALYFGMSLVISIAIITLREPLVRSRKRAKLLLKDAQAVNDMAQRLATLTEPDSIKRTAAELAATVGSPPGSTWRRGVFLRVEDGRTSVDSQFDQFDAMGSALDFGWPSPEDPLVEQALRTGAVSSGPVFDPKGIPDGDGAGRARGITHATWVPIAPNGQFLGLLGVANQREPVPDTSIDQLVSLGHLVELALSNWAAHEKLEEVATREDRRRIARELHDGLAQELAFIASKTAPSTLAGGTPETVRQLADAADRALDEARRAIVILSEEPEALHVSIGQTVEDLTARHGMTAQLDVAEDIVLGGEATENLLRIVREAITNAARHGHASTVCVSLAQQAGVINLLVTDNGKGFDNDGRHQGQGFGLTFMQERCALIGGCLDISSRPGLGTRVEVRLPA
jgi:signal transduction histidine kinase